MIGRFFTALLLAGFLCSGLANAAEPAAVQEKLDPRVDQLMRRACQDLASTKAFTFHAEITFDQVLPSNVKLNFAAAMDFAMQRPDMLAVDYQGDLGAKLMWYSGTELTILDPRRMVYATATVPNTIDAMMETLLKSHNLTIPLGDLAHSHPCELFAKGVTFSRYVGLNDADGVDCDHVALSEENVDFQVWLQHAGRPLVRKIVINYRSQRGAPEYAAVISDWKFPAEIPAARFKPELPKKAVRIDLMNVKEEGRP